MFTKSVIVKGCLFGFMMMALMSGCGHGISEQTDADAASPERTAESTALPEVSEAVPSKVSETSPAKEPEASVAAPAETAAALPEETAKAAGTKIYEGLYFDERFYQYVSMPQEESPLIYCEITISNVTDTAFDFVIDEKVMATGETKNLVPASTAMISAGTSKAVYQGENLTLTFVFPDDENTFPQHLEISGMEQLENNVYMNNTIPGHESG